MPNTRIETDAAPKPNSNYAQGVVAPAGSRLVHVAGQLGMTPDGVLAEGAEAQLEQAWANVLAILAAAEMGPADIIDIRVFLTDRAAVPLARKVRDKVLGGHLAASTLLICGLADARWLAEVAVTAASDRG